MTCRRYYVWPERDTYGNWTVRDGEGLKWVCDCPTRTMARRIARLLNADTEPKE